MKKKLICFLILGVLLFSNAIGTFVSDNEGLINMSSITVDEEIVDIGSGFYLVTVDKSDKKAVIENNEVGFSDFNNLGTASKTVWNSAKSLSGTNMSPSFSLRGDWKYFKVWIDNTGSDDIIVSLTSRSKTGNEVASGTAKAGKQYVLAQNKTFDKGKYYVNMTCGKSNMSGKIQVRKASSYNELDV